MKTQFCPTCGLVLKRKGCRQSHGAMLCPTCPSSKVRLSGRGLIAVAPVVLALAFVLLPRFGHPGPETTLLQALLGLIFSPEVIFVTMGPVDAGHWRHA